MALPGADPGAAPGPPQTLPPIITASLQPSCIRILPVKPTPPATGPCPVPKATTSQPCLPRSSATGGWTSSTGRQGGQRSLTYSSRCSGMTASRRRWAPTPLPSLPSHPASPLSIHAHTPPLHVRLRHPRYTRTWHPLYTRTQASGHMESAGDPCHVFATCLASPLFSLVPVWLLCALPCACGPSCPSICIFRVPLTSYLSVPFMDMLTPAAAAAAAAAAMTDILALLQLL